MKLTHNNNAYIELFLHIKKLAEKAYVAANGKKPNSSHFPAMSAACEYMGVIGCKDSSKSPSSIAYKDDLKDRLENKLAGTIGQHSGPDNYVIGGCAEQVAANDVIRKLNNNPNIPDLTFTEAFQPRTMKMRDWCNNCHQVFD